MVEKLKDNRIAIAFAILAIGIFLPVKVYGYALALSALILILTVKPIVPTTFSLPLMLVLLFIFMGLGLLWTSDLKSGLSLMERSLTFLLLPLLFVFYGFRIVPKDFTIITRSFVFATIVTSLICYSTAACNIITNNSLKVVSLTERDYYYFSYIYLTRSVNIDPIYLSLIVNFAVVLTLNDISLNKINRISIASYLSLFVVLIASKLGILFLVFLWLSFILGRIKSPLIKVGIIIIPLVGGILLVSKVPFLKDRFVNSLHYKFDEPYAGNWNSYSQRLAIWDCAVQAIHTAPIWGHGTGGGQKKLEEFYFKNGYIRGIEDHYNAHSEYLQRWLDLGLPGLLVLFSVIILLPIWQWPKSIVNRPLILNFVLIILFYMLIESILMRQKGIVFFTFFYSLFSYDILYKKNCNVSMV